jgi:predicted RNase H-like nuclease (RuvC/YqgF family)
MANRDGGSGSLGTLLAGALIGAAGLGWWLLSEAERRRSQQRQDSSLRVNRLSWTGEDTLENQVNRPPLRESELQDKVHELNQAIEDVRRQLESLSTQN